jgi:hypothetical protein
MLFFWNLINNQTEIDRYWQKKKFLLSEKFGKYRSSAFAPQDWNKCQNEKKPSENVKGI